MRILEVITLHGERLNDPLWLGRLEAPGLKGSYCLLGTDNAEVCVDDGRSCRYLDPGQLMLLAPGEAPRLRPRPGGKTGRAEKSEVTGGKGRESAKHPGGRGSESSGTQGAGPSGFVGAVFFDPDSSSNLQNILQLLLRHHGPLSAEQILGSTSHSAFTSGAGQTGGTTSGGQAPGLMQAFYNRLYEQFAGQSVFSMQAAYHGLASFLYQLAEGAARHAPSVGESVHIERALELMNMRVRGNLSLTELAEEVHLSEAHFIRLFRRKMQMSPMKYFMRQKVHAAANMIIQGVKVKEAAELTGFYNDAHFSKQFKKYMGIPPKEYKPHAPELKKSRSSEHQKSLSFLTSVLADFIDAIPDMVFFKDSFFVYRLCNSAFSEYVGLSKEDICGQTDFTIFPSDVAAAYRRYDGRVMRTKKAHANEEWVVYPDGRTFFLEAYKAPFFGPNQELLGIVAVCRDITGRSGRSRPPEPLSDS